jgi:hypothetical protein
VELHRPPVAGLSAIQAGTGIFRKSLELSRRHMTRPWLHFDGDRPHHNFRKGDIHAIVDFLAANVVEIDTVLLVGNRRFWFNCWEILLNNDQKK